MTSMLTIMMAFSSSHIHVAALRSENGKIVQAWIALLRQRFKNQRFLLSKHSFRKNGVCHNLALPKNQEAKKNREIDLFLQFTKF